MMNTILLPWNPVGGMVLPTGPIVSAPVGIASTLVGVGIVVLGNNKKG